LCCCTSLFEFFFCSESSFLPLLSSFFLTITPHLCPRTFLPHSLMFYDREWVGLQEALKGSPHPLINLLLFFFLFFGPPKFPQTFMLSKPLVLAIPCRRISRALFRWMFSFSIPVHIVGVSRYFFFVSYFVGSFGLGGPLIFPFLLSPDYILFHSNVVGFFHVSFSSRNVNL